MKRNKFGDMEMAIYLKSISIQGTKWDHEKRLLFRISLVQVGVMCKHILAEAMQEAVIKDGLNAKNAGSVSQKRQSNKSFSVL